MAQGDRAKRLREEHAAAAAADAAVAPTTAESSITPVIATTEQLEAFVKGIQAEINAGNYERTAGILSTMISAQGSPATIKPDQLGLLIQSAGMANIPGIPSKINASLKEQNPNHVNLTSQQLSNIANIGSLDASTFMETISGLVPEEGMEVFNRYAVADAAEPEQQATRLAAAEEQARENEGKREDIDWLRLFTDEDYQQTKGLEILGMFSKFKDLSQSLMSSNNELMRTIGNFLSTVIGTVEPMVSNFLNVEPQNVASGDPEHDESVAAARASQAGRNTFQIAAADTTEDTTLRPAPASTHDVTPGG